MYAGADSGEVTISQKPSIIVVSYVEIRRALTFAHVCLPERTAARTSADTISQKSQSLEHIIDYIYYFSSTISHLLLLIYYCSSTIAHLLVLNSQCLQHIYYIKPL